MKRNIAVIPEITYSTTMASCWLQAFARFRKAPQKNEERYPSGDVEKIQHGYLD